jgi:Tfp pilus assembly protein PilF
MREICDAAAPQVSHGKLSRTRGLEGCLLPESGLPLRSVFAALLLPVFLAACGAAMDPPGRAASALAPQDASGPIFPDGPYRRGAEHFNRGEYGVAERYFREAVEKAPKDASSWIGLAASYDRLRRFDLADRAYQEAIKLSGETAQILNNQGYSYLLRGNLAAAKAKLSKACALDPDNATLVNNMKLLDAGSQYIKPDAL